MSVELLILLLTLVIAFVIFMLAKWFVGTRKLAFEKEQKRVQEELQEVSNWRSQHNSLYRHSILSKKTSFEPLPKKSSDLRSSKDNEDSQEWLAQHNSLHREPTERELELQEVKRELARKAREEQLALERRYEQERSERIAAQEAESKLRAEESAKRERAAELWRSMSKEEQMSHWLSTRERPQSQSFGISPRGAELLTARWLEFLGEEHVEVTQYAGDGGVDVLTKNFCCQVKNYTKTSVSSSEVRDLLGTATSLGLKPLVFTSSTLSTDASMFCEQNSISAIRYDALNAELRGLTSWGNDFLISGQYF